MVGCGVGFDGLVSGRLFGEFSGGGVLFFLWHFYKNKVFNGEGRETPREFGTKVKSDFFKVPITSKNHAIFTV